MQSWSMRHMRHTYGHLWRAVTTASLFSIEYWIAMPAFAALELVVELMKYIFLITDDLRLILYSDSSGVTQNNVVAQPEVTWKFTIKWFS